MAHQAQEEFIKNCFARFNQRILASRNILEVGSQDINGSIKDYFPNLYEKKWVGLDVGYGKGVDFTIPGELVQLPNGWADIAISSECFEHAKNWTQIFKNMIRITHFNSLIILTFAGQGRAAHGTIDSETDSSPFTNNYYKNINLINFASSCELDKYFSKYAIETNLLDGDTYFWGIRNNSYADTEIISNEESLARVRGQLGMVIEKNRIIEKEISYIRGSIFLYPIFLKIMKLLKKLKIKI
tara:strand:- start:2411 stop:3136 length:726 start_codon:yes stop_codon:yes gene_type:complete